LEKSHPELKRFADFGRIKGLKASMKETTFQSSAYGKRENIETSISGRVIFDILPYMYRNHKLSSYSLNSVSAEFLGQQKEDVHHSIITDLQNGSDADRRRLAVYCLKDSFLPQQLMSKLSILVNYVEMARVTGVPINFLLTRGQQIKVFSMILRKTRKENLLVPNMNRHSGEESTYEGATVIEPKKAFYEVPVATLDFASLYPSIMQVSTFLCSSSLHE
jgi:DNA polymerase delta subunit 1